MTQRSSLIDDFYRDHQLAASIVDMDDDCIEVYGGTDDLDMEIDDEGNAYECCPAGDNGHLFLTCCGVTRCVNCQKIVGA